MPVSGEEDMPDKYPSPVQAGTQTVNKVEGESAGQQWGREVTKTGEES